MRIFEHIRDLESCVGESLGTSEWLPVEQGRIDLFAEATGDHQWLHVDAERARAGPFGTTVAHGFLTLSLLPAFLKTAFTIVDSGSGINYGLDKVRFPAPVPVGSSLRARFRLLAYEALAGGGAQLKVEATVDRQGAAKPVCIAEMIFRRYP